MEIGRASLSHRHCHACKLTDAATKLLDQESHLFVLIELTEPATVSLPRPF